MYSGVSREFRAVQGRSWRSQGVSGGPMGISSGFRRSLVRLKGSFQRISSSTGKNQEVHSAESKLFITHGYECKSVCCGGPVC